MPQKKPRRLPGAGLSFGMMRAMTPLRPDSRPSMSCVMPAYNEARNLGRVVPEVLAAMRALSDDVELIVVDDGSRDDTTAVMRQLCAAHPGVVYLKLSRNFGKEAALTAGIDATRGDVVAMLDADGQHPSSLLPDMLAKWREGFDVVYAVRRTRDDQSRLQAGMTDMFYSLVNWGNRVQIPPHAGDFRMMDRRVVEALKAMPERNRFMKGLYAWVGFNSTAIDYEPLAREAGQTSFGFRGAMQLAITGIVAFSTAPLRALTFIGLLLALGAMGYGAWVIGEYFITGNTPPGYPTIVVGMMFFSGIQLMSIGILAEYVGRIYEEVKRRPTYLVSLRQGRGLPLPPGQVDATAAPWTHEQDALPLP
jgi:glycosyltransferase involved in cell wall biosynthesis